MKFLQLLIVGVCLLFTTSAKDLNLKVEQSDTFEVLIRVSAKVYSGSQPDSESAFQELKKLGVTTIVSVDGAKPNTKMAERYGLRYIHIPIGYGELEENDSLSLAHVAKLDEVLFVHCHHGKHRGPAAVAVIMIDKGSCTNEEALQILHKAGTGKSYKGLWESVRSKKKTPQDQRLPKLVPIAKVESITESMAAIDRIYDELKASSAISWEVPEGKPDFSASQQALILKEALRESGRLLNNDDAKFRSFFHASEAIAGKLQSALKNNDLKDASILLQHLKKTCVDCHKKYRD